MLTLIASSLLLTQCISYGADGTLEEQFDQCLAGEWGEEGCASGRTIQHSGYENAEGEACTIDYAIRDPHTGGFRIGSLCGDATDDEIAVWIVEDGQLKLGDTVAGFETVAWRCEVPED